ncbi:pilus assembly protein TadG-related protein, partial [uncultured Anaerovibrio sp.]|uniref:pilus assembly protein TadG-related protein n=1 Tax=uncultured Anaerovibrio sp. TaxID=361586 RepID=UPI0025E7BDB4
MLIVGTGLAVDLGHVYVQYSRLQNAADAAALAGAHEYAFQGEKENNHPKADKMAEQYVQGEYHNLNPSESIIERKYQAKSKDKITYYRVKLTKEVPLYFLGGIYKKFKKKETFTVPVYSVAVVPKRAGGGFFNNMFIFKEKFDAVNSLENPDKLSNNSYSTDSKNMITTTFDGRIVYTKGDGVNNPNYKYESLSYSTQTPKLDRFFTSAAREKNASNNINTLMEGKDEDKAKFDENGTLKSGYWSRAEYYNYNFKTFYDYMEKMTANTENKASDQTVKTSSNLFDSDIIRVPKTNSIPNLTIEVDKSLGNNDKPVYIYVEAG